MEIELKRARSARGLALIMLAAILWGTVGVTTQALYKLSSTTALSIGFLRLALATPPLVVLCWGQLGRGALRITGCDLALMVCMGAMLALYQVCFFAAIAHAGVAIAALITLCTAPVLVALISAVLMRERLSGALLLALGLALAGTLLLVGFEPNATLPSSMLTGALLALGSATGYALITIFGRLLARRCHPLQITSVSFSVGALLLLAVVAAVGFAGSYPAEGWLLLVYLGLIPSALAYALFLSGMRSTSATTASVATLIEPLTATLLAWLIFAEPIAPSGLSGALLLFLAMGLLVLRQRE